MSMSLSLSSKSEPGRSEAKNWRFTPLGIPEVMLVEAPRFGDARGWLSETYSQRVFAAHGVNLDFVQDNTSYSAAAGIVRGLHYQALPYAQHKLVRVLQGRILDVVVDIRRSAPSFGRHVAIELSAENGLALLVPAGFAHGFVSREPHTLVTYKVTAFYAPDHDHGIFWADPRLRIDWGIGEAEATLSPKDKGLPRLERAEHLFA
jgi:dTDP-4-dehydrorhamnose 3,5-epimerase